MARWTKTRTLGGLEKWRDMRAHRRRCSTHESSQRMRLNVGALAAMHSSTVAALVHFTRDVTKWETNFLIVIASPPLGRWLPVRQGNTFGMARDRPV